MLLFLDTEFTELSHDADLISIGLSSKMGDFYGENMDFDRHNSSEWVVKNIYPLLDFSKDGKKRSELSASVWEFISSFNEEVSIVVDSDYDVMRLGELFLWEKHPNIKRFCNIFQLLLVNATQVLSYNDYPLVQSMYERQRDRFFKENYNHIQHHALSDAKANLFAFEKIITNFDEKELKYV